MAVPAEGRRHQVWFLFDDVVSVEDLLHIQRDEPKQKWELNNVALKFLRDSVEAAGPDHPGWDFARGDFVPIGVLLRDSGMDYTFEAHRRQPWSWKRFLAALKPDDMERVVGPGIARFGLCGFPDTYDHKRHTAATRAGRPQKPDLQVWDFIVVRTDNTGVACHPDLKSRKVGIRDLTVWPTSAPPAAGRGGSDGHGTFRGFVKRNYPAIVRAPPVVGQRDGCGVGSAAAPAATRPLMGPLIDGAVPWTQAEATAWSAAAVAAQPGATPPGLAEGQGKSPPPPPPPGLPPPPPGLPF